MEKNIKETIKLVINKKDEHYFTFEIDGIPHRFNNKWLNCVSDYHAHLWISDPYYRKNTINAIIESEL